IFPQKYLGFRLKGLRAPLSTLKAQSFDLLFEFDSSISRLGSVINSSMFALYAVPATNLFEMETARVPINRAEHEHQIVSDRTKWLDFEAHRVLSVFAHYPSRKEKVPVFPLYSLPTTNMRIEDALYYTVRRLPRLPTERERRFGSQTRYV